MSSRDYVHNVIQLAEEMARQPMSKDGCSEIDVNSTLEPKEAQQFQQLIGMLRCATERGKVDILYEVSILSSRLRQPGYREVLEIMFLLCFLSKHVF